ncbi:hypothetical protein GQF42_09890 [Streptomyces broussonetiae]|uniref:Uncharacterized protein n=1 Tax=Streptomyces broussonetiae TaxID=2686304 RepID=A0A6I6NNF3_9ACTN|nr:hypothetical protein GQF42_09890 [Streptomyces broussonetiae]
MIKPCGPYDFLPPIRTFSLTSQSVARGEQLAREQVSGILGAGGSDISPQLSWSGFPRRHRVSRWRCPTPMCPHFLVVHAVGVEELNVSGTSTPACLDFLLFTHAIARAAVYGTFERV